MCFFQFFSEKKILAEAFENGYWFDDFLVGLLVLTPYRFTMGFVHVDFDSTEQVEVQSHIWLRLHVLQSIRHCSPNN